MCTRNSSRIRKATKKTTKKTHTKKHTLTHKTKLEPTSTRKFPIIRCTSPFHFDPSRPQGASCVFPRLHQRRAQRDSQHRAPLRPEEQKRGERAQPPIDGLAEEGIHSTAHSTHDRIRRRNRLVQTYSAAVVFERRRETAKIGRSLMDGRTDG